MGTETKGRIELLTSTPPGLRTETLRVRPVPLPPEGGAVVLRHSHARGPRTGGLGCPPCVPGMVSETPDWTLGHFCPSVTGLVTAVSLTPGYRR